MTFERTYLLPLISCGSVGSLFSFCTQSKHVPMLAPAYYTPASVENENNEWILSSLPDFSHKFLLCKVSHEKHMMPWWMGKNSKNIIIIYLWLNNNSINRIRVNMLSEQQQWGITKNAFFIISKYFNCNHCETNWLREQFSRLN